MCNINNIITKITVGLLGHFERTKEKINLTMSRPYSFNSPPDQAAFPPEGVIPDFQDPFSLRPYNNVTVSLGLVFASLFLGLRLYTKIRIVKECLWEDCRLLERTGM